MCITHVLYYYSKSLGKMNSKGYSEVEKYIILSVDLDLRVGMSCLDHIFRRKKGGFCSFLWNITKRFPMGQQ